MSANGRIVSILASAARTATPADVELEAGGHRGLVLVVDVTAVTLTPSITVTVKGLDPVSGQDWTILASAAITTVSTTVLRVHPSLTAAANLVAEDLLAPQMAVAVAHGDADSITYSVTAHLTP
jgi:hypothetical protein